MNETKQQPEVPTTFAQALRLAADLQEALESAIEAKRHEATPPVLTEVVGLGHMGHFAKSGRVPLFTKTGHHAVATTCDFSVEVGGKMLWIKQGAEVDTPEVHTPGQDYEIVVFEDGQLLAVKAGGKMMEKLPKRSIGGYHFALGGNATGTNGGDETPQINQHSLWDLKHRPACANPAGMTLVANSFWADIYLLGVNHESGTSKARETIADRLNPPIVPMAFGGDGQKTYEGFNWYEAQEVMASHGKRLPTHREFSALAFGTTEGKSAGTEPETNTLRPAFTSKWGVMLATGNLWVWGDELMGGKWEDNETGGRGNAYNDQHAVLFGGSWCGGAISGSRCSAWGNSPSLSDNLVGARGVCDHLSLD